MQPSLEGVKIAVLGGDARELVMVRELALSGAIVRVAGLPAGSDSERIIFCQYLRESVNDVQAVVLPVLGINEKGRLQCPFADRPLVLTEEVLLQIPDGVPVFVGTAGPLLTEMAGRCGIRLVELMKMDEVAILNSIPSAEGAIQIAMEKLPITIHGSSAFVLGFGRTGQTLARMLGAIGAQTRVVARNPAHRARIGEMGLEPLSFQELSGCIKEADIIFNTVPALVLTEDILQNVSPAALIVDLASSPGGTDFKAAEKLGINAILAPGLPARVAPKTAGQILARTIIRLLVQRLEASPCTKTLNTIV